MSGKDKHFAVVLVAPSGTGKTTLCKHLLKRMSKVKYSISATTRKPRLDEIHGKDYYFLSKNTFQEWIQEGKFCEWAEVYDNLYGTPKEKLTGYLSQGFNVILDLDYQGARALKQEYPETVSIFVLPPSMAELTQRLVKRDKVSVDTDKRLKSAKEELTRIKEFDYVVINEDIDRTVEKISAIIVAEECKPKRL